MKDFLISSYIDDELDLDEKIEFVEAVHEKADFKDETVDLLHQEKLVRDEVVERTFSTQNNRISSIFLYYFQYRNYLEQ